MSDALRDLARGWQLPGDSAAIGFSRHAVERYRERIRPSLECEAVKAELSRLLATALVTRERPAWLTEDEHGTAAYLLLADGEICLPLMRRAAGELYSTTCLFRGQMAAIHRSRLNSNAQTRRAGKKAGRRANRMETGRPVRGPSADEWTD